MIELLVVMVIIAILTGASVYQFRSARFASAKNEAKAVASTYQKAVELFRLDHGGSAPSTSIPTCDWCTAGSPGTLDLRGPINQRSPNTYTFYARRVPAAMSDGRVCLLSASRAITVTSSGAAQVVIPTSCARAQSAVLYVQGYLPASTDPTRQAQYGFGIYFKKSQSWWPVCAYSTYPSGTNPFNLPPASC